MSIIERGFNSDSDTPEESEQRYANEPGLAFDGQTGKLLPQHVSSVNRYRYKIRNQFVVGELAAFVTDQSILQDIERSGPRPSAPEHPDETPN